MEFKIDELELLSACETPTLEGVSWITLQVIEHCFNSISNKDVISRKEIPRLLSEYVEDFNRINQENAIRPLPNDILLQLVDYSKKSLDEIFRNTKSRLIKEDKMINPHQLKNVTSKTMNWLGKQPGRNIKEKMAAKNRILSQVSNYSYNTNENQIVKKYCIIMEKFLKTRVESGTNYDCNEMDEKNFDKISEFLELINEIKDNNLQYVEPSIKVQANNILLNHKDYLKVWKALNELVKYEQKIKEDYGNILERFSYLLFLNINSNIYKFEDTVLIDSETLKIDINGKIKMEGLNNKIKFFIGSNLDDFLKGKIIFIDKEKKFGFVKGYDNKKYYLKENFLKNKEVFKELETNENILFKFKKSKKEEEDDIVVDIRISNRMWTIDSYVESNRIIVEVFEIQEINGELKYKFLTKFTYELILSEGLRNSRGVKFFVQKSEYHVLNERYKFESYADIKGLKSLSKMIIDEVTSVIGRTFVEKLPIESDVKSNDITVDFTANDFKVFSNTKQIENQKIIKYGTLINENLYFMGENKGLKIPIEYKSIAISDVFETKNFQALKLFENSVRSVSNFLREEETLLYNIPDNIDEFSQKSIKIIMKLNNPKSYPVWKSINAGYYFIGNNDVKHNEKVLIIDTNSNETYATQLKIVKVAEEYTLEHYVPYLVEENENEINIKYFELLYLSLFLKKNEIYLQNESLDNIIKRGIISKILLYKIESIEYLKEEDKFIKIFYDSEIYKKSYEKFLENFKNYTQKLFEEIENLSYDYVLLIGNHLTENPKLGDIFRKIKGLNSYKIISDKMLFHGSTILRERIRKNKVTWYEYLPNLSLEVIKNGHFGELELIKNKSIENVMGKEEYINIGEVLVLPKGHKFYNFPLNKISAGKKNIEINVKIYSDKFPLEYDLEVELALKYIYGNENSYELIVKPKDSSEIIKILCEWEEKKRVKDLRKIYPTYPFTSLSIKELIKEINILKELIRRIEKIINTKVSKNIANKSDLEYIECQLFRNINRLKKVVMNESDDVTKFIDDFYTNNALIALLVMNNKNSNYEYGRLDETIYNFLCCFGKKTSENLKSVVLEKYDKKNKSQVLSSLLLGNSSNSEILEKITTHNQPNEMIRSLRHSIWFDKNILFDLFNYNSNYVYQIIEIIKNEFKHISTKFKPRAILVYRDFSEVLFAILMLRENDNFFGLEVGSEESFLLAKYIKKIDYHIYNSGEEFKSRIKFSLKKPESLKNMSDLSYALYVFLTGEESINLPEILLIEEED